MKQILKNITQFVLGIILVLAVPWMVHPAEEVIALSVFDIPWAMKVKMPGFALEQRQSHPGGQGAYFMASNMETGLIVSGQIQKAGRAGTATDAREYFWAETKKLPFRMVDIKMSESGQTAMVEYMIREHQGIPVNQKNLWAYFAKGRYWMNIHLSKMNFGPADEDLFKPILKGVSFEEKREEGKIENHYRVSEKYILVLEVPEKWVDDIQRPSKDLPPTIALKPNRFPASKVLVSPLWSPQKEVGFNSAEKIRKILEEEGRGALEEAVEKELIFHEIKGRSGIGWYFTLTDKASHIKPGEFKYITQGGVGVGSLLLMFTIFTNEKGSPDVPAGLELIGKGKVIEKGRRG